MQHLATRSTQMSLLLVAVTVLWQVSNGVSLPKPPQSFVDIPMYRPLKLSGRTCCTTPGTVNCCTGPGLTYDRCDATRPCAPPRFCRLEFSDDMCPWGDAFCQCVPLQMISCSHPDQCPEGETCARHEGGDPYCYSEQVVLIDSTFVEYFGDSCCPTPTPNCQPSCPSPPSPVPPTPSPRPSKEYGPSPSPDEISPSPRPTKTSSPRPSSSYTPPSPEPSRSSSMTSSPSPQPPSKSPIPEDSPKPSTVHLTPRPTTSPSPVVTYSRGPNPTPSPSRPPGGLCGDVCSPSNPCLKWRECLLPDLSPCDTGCDSGVCMNSMVCRCSDDCEDGEVCAGAEGRTYCFSPRVVDQPGITVYPCSPPGQTGDRCDDDSDCADARTCVRGGGDDNSTCADNNILCGPDRTRCDGNYPYGCYCDQHKQCTCTDDCEPSEFCCGVDNVGRICVSRSIVQNSTKLDPIPCGDEPVPGFGQSYVLQAPGPPRSGDTGTGSASSSPTGDPSSTSSGSPTGDVCVDVRALQAFAHHELVFAEHVRSAVLCDLSDSCATPGHMVQYHGSPMTMRKYCSIVGTCSRRVLLVNSPKFRKRLRIPSNTDDLYFTPLAARYGTQVEEVFLGIVIRLGL